MLRVRSVVCRFSASIVDSSGLSKILTCHQAPPGSERHLFRASPVQGPRLLCIPTVLVKKCVYFFRSWRLYDAAPQRATQMKIAITIDSQLDRLLLSSIEFDARRNARDSIEKEPESGLIWRKIYTHLFIITVSLIYAYLRLKPFGFGLEAAHRRTHYLEPTLCVFERLESISATSKRVTPCAIPEQTGPGPNWQRCSMFLPRLITYDQQLRRKTSHLRSESRISDFVTFTIFVISQRS